MITCLKKDEELLPGFVILRASFSFEKVLFFPGDLDNLEIPFL
jgi:hypothetical protein